MSNDSFSCAAIGSSAQSVRRTPVRSFTGRYSIRSGSIAASKRRLGEPGLLLKSRTMTKTEALKIAVEGAGEVSGLLLQPEDARWLMLLAHGAGAGMRHPFMERLAGELASVGIATLRYQFPYMEERRGRPDSPARLTATVAA